MYEKFNSSILSVYIIPTVMWHALLGTGYMISSKTKKDGACQRAYVLLEKDKKIETQIG